VIIIVANLWFNEEDLALMIIKIKIDSTEIPTRSCNENAKIAIIPPAKKMFLLLDLFIFS
jgi:hypothetical protein